MLIFCSQPNLFILKLKCVKVLELVFQKRVFPYYIWILIIYCSFKKRGSNWGELWCLVPWLSCFIGGVYRENHQHDAKYLQTLSYNVVLSTLRHERDSNSLNVSGDRH